MDALPAETHTATPNAWKNPLKIQPQEETQATQQHPTEQKQQTQSYDFWDHRMRRIAKQEMQSLQSQINSLKHTRNQQNTVDVKHTSQTEFERLKREWKDLMESGVEITGTDVDSRKKQEMVKLNQTLESSDHTKEDEKYGIELMDSWLGKHLPRTNLPLFLRLKIKGKFCDWICNSSYKHWGGSWYLTEAEKQTLKDAQREYQLANNTQDYKWNERDKRPFFKPPEAFNKIPRAEQDRAKAAWKRAVMYDEDDEKQFEHRVMSKEGDDTRIYGTPFCASVPCNPYFLDLEL
jgi:hypothetical protein